MISLVAAAVLTAPTIANPSFEDVRNGNPTGWRRSTWAGQADFRLEDAGHTGKCASVGSTAGADAGWSTDIPVLPFSKYRITYWTRTEGIEKTTGQGAGVNLHGRQEHGEMLTGTTNWTEKSFEFQSGASDAVQLNALIGFHGLAKGRVWFDDFSMTLLETRPMNPSFGLDFGPQYDPISPYIYSQFIEHMGRCIYGGIWAEMLEDRKFYYAVNEKPSPWFKDPRSQVQMDTKEPFVGDHTPLVSGGIAQGDIWLQKGRKYVGYAWLKPRGEEKQIRVSIGAHSQDFKVPADQWKKIEFFFTSEEDTKGAIFSLSSDYSGGFWVGTASLMPADNVQGMRADTLALLKELNAPLYRWPGGNFVSGYDWRDGIGDRDRRPPRKNPAWMGIEHNDFGTHEFLAFCKLIKTEPLIVVNTGFGDAHSATEWLQYVNGAASTEQGQKRAKNGQHEPWDVKWWGIGNEMFGNWQLGYMSLDQYILKHNIFYDRMMKEDPTIKTIGVGEIGGGWSEGMLKGSANQMTLISEHFYTQEQPGVMAHVNLVPNAIKAKVAAHRRYRETIPELKGKDIRIAMDEWNYWYGPHVFGELGTRYFVKDGLGIAAGLHEFYRSTDIVTMAQYAQTVNVIGAIKTTPTAASFETTGLVLKLYREHFGVHPVKVTGAPAPLDVSAALTEDRKFLTIAIVNPTGASVSVPVEWGGAKLAGAGQAWEIAHDDPMAHNNPGDPPVVEIKSRAVGSTDKLTIKPYSATLFKLPLSK